ncbi:MAG: hypothetical protein ACMZ64_07550 [Oleiphilus sp.]
MLETVANQKSKHVKTEFFAIMPEHNIVTVDLFGTWNEQQTLDFVAEFKRLVHRYFTQEWACVINLQHLDMLLSESFQIQTFKALNAWSYIKGMKAISVVVSHKNRSHLLYQFEEIFKVNHPYATAVCYSELESANWMADHGFKPRQKKTASAFSHVISA